MRQNVFFYSVIGPYRTIKLNVMLGNDEWYFFTVHIIVTWISKPSNFIIIYSKLWSLMRVFLISLPKERPCRFHWWINQMWLRPNIYQMVNGNLCKLKLRRVKSPPKMTANKVFRCLCKICRFLWMENENPLKWKLCLAE